MLKVKGGLIKVDPDIFYKIINPQHELPYKKYNGDIAGVRLSTAGYPQIVVIDKTRKAERGKRKPIKVIALSRYIMNAREGEIVDHKNRDKLDNRRENLRIATQRQNILNSVNKNKSGYFGVSVRFQNGKYYCIGHLYKNYGKVLRFYALDSPENRIIAAFARDKFVLQAGEEEYAPMNFPCWKNEPLRSILLAEDLRKYKGKN